MKVICTKCGSMQVLCEAWINPNERETEKAFDHFSDDSFNYGYCMCCDNSAILTDCDKIRERIDKEYYAYKKLSKKEPYAARCEITYCSPRNGTEEVLIKISADENGHKNYFPFCENVNALKKLCGKSRERFIVTNIYCFE